MKEEMIGKALTKEEVKKMLQLKLPRCAYPGCLKVGKYKFPLQLINEENASVELPFCEYHHLIIVGGHFKALIHKNKEKKDEFEIVGPLKEIELIQQVMGAREMMKNKEFEKKLAEQDKKLKSNNKEFK